MNAPAAPRWLAEELWLRELLHWYVDRCTAPRLRPISRRIKEKTVPALFRFSEETDYRWRLIECLARDYGIFTIHYNPTPRSAERYDNAQLYLQPQAEPILRAWLERPVLAPLRAAWQQAIAAYSGCFADGGAALSGNYPIPPGYTPEELAEAFAEIGNWLNRDLTLREISARCFRGNSKFLDHRQELLAKLFGDRVAAVPPRPLLLTACAPYGFDQLLIVENQDSYLRLAERPLPGTALLNSGGFRASAARLTSGHTRFSFLPGSDAGYFSRHWLDAGIRRFFWGDLDYAGLSILAGLRHSLPDLEAWQPGYQPMLDVLRGGSGHRPDEARKGGQTDPGATGCLYTDRQLLPALRDKGKFLDQEGFAPDSGDTACS